MQCLCCLDVRGPKAMDVIEQFIDDSQETPGVIEGAKALLKATFENFAECDKLLSRHAHHWDMGRLALVDRNILRLAAQEIRSGQTPFKVAISEALHLAEEFSTAESSRFINGVLDSVAKELLQAAPGQAARQDNTQPQATTQTPAKETVD